LAGVRASRSGRSNEPAMRSHRSIVLPWPKHGPGSRKSAASIDVAEAHGLFWHCSKRFLASVIIRCQCCSTSRSISCLRFGPSRVGYQPERSAARCISSNMLLGHLSVLSHNLRQNPLKQLRNIYLSCCRLRASGALRIDPTCSLPYVGSMALAEGSTTSLSCGFSRSKPEVCTGPLG
jgi:hypothetical protein